MLDDDMTNVGFSALVVYAVGEWLSIENEKGNRESPQIIKGWLLNQPLNHRNFTPWKSYIIPVERNQQFIYLFFTIGMEIGVLLGENDVLVEGQRHVSCSNTRSKCEFHLEEIWLKISMCIWQHFFSLNSWAWISHIFLDAAAVDGLDFCQKYTVHGPVIRESRLTTNIW